MAANFRFISFPCLLWSFWWWDMGLSYSRFLSFLCPRPADLYFRLFTSCRLRRCSGCQQRGSRFGSSSNSSCEANRPLIAALISSAGRTIDLELFSLSLCSASLRLITVSLASAVFDAPTEHSASDAEWVNDHECSPMQWRATLLFETRSFVHLGTTELHFSATDMSYIAKR